MIHLHLRRGKIPPHIINADHNREPIGAQGQYIGRPTSRQITHRVAANAHVDETQLLRGVGGVDNSLDKAYVAIA